MSRRRSSAHVALLLLAGGAAVGCGGPPKEGASAAAAAATAAAHAGGASRVLTRDELRPLSLTELQRLRAEIFGRHGRSFRDSALQRWLAAQPWYRPDTGFTNDRLTPVERANLDLVREAEAAKHAHIEPGDMRFYQDRVITGEMLGAHTPQDWEVLAAEVSAVHGYVFDEGYDEDGDATAAMARSELQQYFDERYWYVRNPGFATKDLSAIEQQNLDTITLAMTRQLGRAVSPGMMHLFRNTPLTEQMLDGVSLHDLRLLRNEVYARHGRPFKTDWLRWHFRGSPWYHERPDFSESELSAVERANIALITRREQRLHEELATRVLTVADLGGLPFDEARRLRNEVYARHGRRFKDPALQRYFASFDWYRPNDDFRESMLNATERQNVDLIRQYESGRFTEG